MNECGWLLFQLYLKTSKALCKASGNCITKWCAWMTNFLHRCITNATLIKALCPISGLFMSSSSSSVKLAKTWNLLLKIWIGVEANWGLGRFDFVTLSFIHIWCTADTCRSGQRFLGHVCIILPNLLIE